MTAGLNNSEQVIHLSALFSHMFYLRYKNKIASLGGYYDF